MHISVHSFFICFIRLIIEAGNRGQGFFWEKYQYAIEIYSGVLFRLTNVVQISKIGLEGTLKIIHFESSCHEQRHSEVQQLALSPDQPGLNTSRSEAATGQPRGELKTKSQNVRNHKNVSS